MRPWEALSSCAFALEMENILFTTKLCCCLVAKLCPTLFPLHGLQPPGILSMEFPRQEYWSGLPFPPRRNLPNPGIKPTSPEAPPQQIDSLPFETPGKPYHKISGFLFCFIIIFNRSVTSVKSYIQLYVYSLMVLERLKGRSGKELG